MKNCKVSWSLVFVLSIIVAIFSYKFTVGEVKPSEDGRLAVQLTKDERNALLLEMRTWLQSTQSVLAAVSEKNFEEVSRVAKISGMSAEADTPASLFRKLPAAMKALGFDTRKKFDEISDDAVKLRNPEHTIKQLSNTMNNCIACHSAYRFTEAYKAPFRLDGFSIASVLVRDSDRFFSEH
jgi:hypothetical protein